MEYPKDIIVADKLGVVRTDSEKEYLAHLLCLGGVTVLTSGTSSCTPGICQLSANGKWSRRSSLRMTSDAR